MSMRLGDHRISKISFHLKKTGEPMDPYVFQNNQWRRLINIKQDNSFEREYHLAYMGGSPTITEPLVKNSLSEQMEDVPE